MRVSVEKIKFFATVHEPVAQTKFQLKILDTDNELWLPKYQQLSLFGTMENDGDSNINSAVV